MVNYQGDLFIGKDGTYYKATQYPEQIDIYGVRRAKPLKEKRLKSGSNKATTSRPNLENVEFEQARQKAQIDKLFENVRLKDEDFGPGWKSIWHIKVFKVF